MTEPRFSVAEIFGPTIQGEGPQVGEPCYFIRLGGCDYRCVWCDSMHAVDPAAVKALPQLTPQEIAFQLDLLPGDYKTVVISGGNPAVWDLAPLIAELKHPKYRGWQIAVETQGSLWRDWLYDVDVLVISPKPPSSKMVLNRNQMREMYRNVTFHQPVETVAVKVVIFNSEDLEFARSIAIDLNLDLLYLSIGTVADEPADKTLQRFRLLSELVLHELHDSPYSFKISPQMHVLAWGHKLGV